MPSPVSLVEGDDRQTALHDALDHVADEVVAELGDADHVLVKPNLVKPHTRLACTHVDAVDALLDWLETHSVHEFTVVASSAGDTDFQAVDYPRLTDDHDATLVDLDAEPHTEVTLDYDPHPITIRVADRLLDRTSPLVSLAKPKTHDTVVATLTVKNVLMGSILRTDGTDDKHEMHQGYPEINHYLARLADRVYPDVGVLDGHRGMQGNGPVDGDPVDHGIALAGTDPLAVDHTALRCMDIDPGDVGYLTYLADEAFGAYSIDGIDVRGEAVADCRRDYDLHATADEQLSWKRAE